MQTLGIPFEERLNVFQEDPHWEPFRQFSPVAQVPCLHDGSTVIWASPGITEYLAEHHPGVWPAAGVARAFVRCGSAEMHAGFAVLRNICTMNCGLRSRLHEVSPALQRNLDRIGIVRLRA